MEGSLGRPVRGSVVSETDGEYDVGVGGRAATEYIQTGQVRQRSMNPKP